MAKDRNKLRARNLKMEKVRNNLSKLKYKKELISQIRIFNDPVLQQKCEVVKEYENINDIIKKMGQILIATVNGVGLAACQIGITKKIIVIRPDVKINKIQFMINPEIICRSSEVEKFQESCLSYPGISHIVARNKIIQVKYLDENFKQIQKEFKNLEARIVSHEIDHTDGICLIGNIYRLKQENG